MNSVCGVEILKSCIPNYLSQIKFSELKQDGDFSGKFILGKVFQIWPIQKTARGGHILKLLMCEVQIDDEEISNEKLTVFLFDGRALDAESLKEQEYIALSGFIVEPLTSSSTYSGVDEVLPFQLLLNPDMNAEGNGKEIQIWIARKKSSTSIGENTAPKAVPESTLRSYVYTPLNELEVTGPTGDRYKHIYGVVMECEMRTALTSQASYVELILADPTLPRFKCLILGKQNDVFPDIHPSDIVRIHRLQVDKYRGQLKGKCFSPKDVLVFSSLCEEELQPQTDATTYVFTDEDKIMIKELKEWFQKTSPLMKTISQFQVGEFRNIACQVVAVAVVKQHQCTILKVWDGTKISCVVDMGSGEHESEKKEEAIFAIAKDYLVAVHAYDCHADTAAELEPGVYVELQNAHLYIPGSKNVAQLCLHGGKGFSRGIKQLNDSNKIVQHLHQKLEKIKSSFRVEEESHHLDLADLSLLNALNSDKSSNKISACHSMEQDWWQTLETASVPVNHYHIHPTFLRDVVAHSSPYKFRVIASVFSCDPPSTDIYKLIHLYCPKCHYLSEDTKSHFESSTMNGARPVIYCPKCSNISYEKDDVSLPVPILTYIYLICFWLQDGTAQIEAFLYGEQAVKFFQGIPPERLLEKDSSAVQQISNFLSHICQRNHPVSEAQGPYPILDCCIIKYTAGSKTRYQIFDTVLT